MRVPELGCEVIEYFIEQTEFKSDRIVARSLPESGVSLCPPLPFYWLEFPVIVHAFHPPLLQPTTYKRTS